MDGWTDDGWRDRGHSLRPHSSRLRAAFVLLLLIGATWLLGLLAVNRDALTFHYLFAVFSCLQVGREVLGHLCHFLSEMPSPEWPWEVPGGVGGSSTQCPSVSLLLGQTGLHHGHGARAATGLGCSKACPIHPGRTEPVVPAQLRPGPPRDPAPRSASQDTVLCSASSGSPLSSRKQRPLGRGSPVGPGGRLHGHSGQAGPEHSLLQTLRALLCASWGRRAGSVT